MADLRRYLHVVYDSARWDGFPFRGDDIVISTPAKCGTTWMQMLCALLLFRTPDLPAPLAELSPWVDMQLRRIDDVISRLEIQPHRRFLKTHTPLDGIPFDPRVTYLHVARDPRDVALSWDNHMANIDFDRFLAARIAVGNFEELGAPVEMSPPPDDPEERFWEWVDGGSFAAEVSSLSHLVGHAATFWDRRDAPNVHLFHYNDLRADLGGQMRRLADVLEVDEPTDELVDAARFEQMKARADELVPNSDTPFWHDNNRFFDKARAGGWRDVIDDEGLRRYDKALAALAPQDLATWLHEGWLASGA